MRTNKKILVADDDFAIRRLFEIALRDHGLDVTVAKHGQEAVDLFKKHTFDLIIIDLRMPVMDGLTAIEKIRALNKDIPIILQGSFKSEETSRRANELGVSAYLVKPFDWWSVEKLVFDFLGLAVAA
jgi:CheY-like chemotaxis protein